MTASNILLRAGLLGAAVALTSLSPSVCAQEMDHSQMQMPMPTEKPAPDKKTTKKPAAKPSAKPVVTEAHEGHDAATAPADKPKPDASMDHSAMGHDMPMPATQQAPVDHATMQHDMSTMPSEAAPMDHAAMGHGAKTTAPAEPRTPIPVVTDEDRAAAVPPPNDHPVHDNTIQHYVLLNRLEAWNADPGTGLAWEGQGWIGTDRNRLWLRSEGERADGRTEAADLEVLYGRSIATWWDLVAGVRHDFKPGDSQSFAAIGVQGLAPQKFEVEATAYVGERGQTAARFEAEYELLLTNRLILQPLVEVNLFGKDDPARGIASGLSTAEAGLRLRYEFTRQFAPYIGVVYERAFGGTADLRRAEDEDINDIRVVAGFRIWF
ncbi:copper resistance protein B (plasmid) [Xanthomonas sp. NCPPB 3583]|uniref:copper resistance protein B n=1 Tax=Xanthomonas sp. NCPPB 3583 TaxID=487558 RepID=UPI003558B7E3